ncbi:MAG: sulfite exporter TauE/SafE family protein [Flavobacteriales bacterium]|jgi:uncharacterized membrane protein YfcA|nr:sulfite exporter TauE/SafE family protein [Flavobacteriales bacterium]
MEIQTFVSLVIIGLLAGTLSGFIGIGGGVVMVPALIFALGISQHEAQGLSLTTMLLPIGILAFYNYYKSGQVTNQFILYAAIIAVAFVIGGYFGSRLSLKLNPLLVKFLFGLLMLYIGFKMIISGWDYFKK